MLDDDCFTVAEAAALMRVSKVTVYRRIKRGELKRHSMHRGACISGADMAAYMARGAKRLSSKFSRG